MRWSRTRSPRDHRRPQTVHAELLDLVERTGTDELMLVSQVVDADQRIAGIERIAQAWELSPQMRAPAAG